jgi:hypothetical protein
MTARMMDSNYEYDYEYEYCECGIIRSGSGSSTMCKTCQNAAYIRACRPKFSTIS